VSLVPEIFRSVELIWILWAISLPVCLGLICTMRQGEPFEWKKLQGEEGAAYSVPYVMTFPIYVMFVGLVVECSLLLVTKIGTMYAAYAATRAAVVWESGKSGSPPYTIQKMQKKMEEKAKRAAILAMIPFASGSSQHSVGGYSGAGLVPPVLVSAELFKKGRFVNKSYLSRKILYAGSHTKIDSIKRDSKASDALLTTTLSFKAPFHIPGIGRLLGSFSAFGYYVIDVQSSATLPSESPQNDTRDIGIQYLSE
jgi:hypothetical protein